MEIEELLLTGGERADVDGLRGVDAHPKKRGAMRDGEMMRAPSFSNPINPRSNKWSVLGVSNNPFSPFNLSSLVESRHGLQWLATR